MPTGCEPLSKGHTHVSVGVEPIAGGSSEDAGSGYEATSYGNNSNNKYINNNSTNEDTEDDSVDHVGADEEGRPEVATGSATSNENSTTQKCNGFWQDDFETFLPFNANIEAPLFYMPVNHR